MWPEFRRCRNIHRHLVLFHRKKVKSAVDFLTGTICKQNVLAFLKLDSKESRWTENRSFVMKTIWILPPKQQICLDVSGNINFHGIEWESRLLEHNLFKNVSKWVIFLWKKQIQTIKYGLNFTKKIKKKQVTLILY